MKYREIYVCADNSEWANESMRLALAIAKHDEARLVGSHVYAARLHDRRFRAMEGGLPPEYQEEQELERQRTIHDSLITKGLKLITDSYLAVPERSCGELAVPFCGVSLEGRNWQELVRDINANECDLVAMGGYGIGRVKDSLLGSVTERVLRRVRRDILICKRNEEENHSDRIVVCLDGSSRSWGALMRGIQLARIFGKRLIAISSFDPYFHYAMFGSLKGVLSSEAKQVFKFEEQEKLHEEIIDSGLAKIYQSHLGVAERIAGDEEIEVESKLLDGKAFEKVLGFVREDPPWLLVLGRIGVHSDEEMDIGGNTENLCRLADCNLLVVDTQYQPPVDYLADEVVSWTKEAEQKMEMVPAMARGVATEAVNRHCLAEGHTVITTSVLDAAIKKLLPAEAIERMGIDLGGDETAGTAYRCKACGFLHHGRRPVSCPVCGKPAESFTLLKDVVAGAESVAAESIDGRALVWEQACLERLETIEDKVERRQMKAKLEKQALSRRQEAITLGMLEEALGGRSTGPVWTDAAVARLERVPAGFMRSSSRKSIEEFAEREEAGEITLEIVEGVLAKVREKMTNAVHRGTQSAGTKSFECSTCGLAISGDEPECCSACDSGDFRRLTEAEWRALPSAASKLLIWSEAALERVEQIPAGFVRKMSKCRIEQWARTHDQHEVTPEVVDAKYASWAEGSKGHESELEWTEGARQRADRIPAFIRPMVVKEIERKVRQRGKMRVDNELLDEVLGGWSRGGSIH